MLWQYHYMIRVFYQLLLILSIIICFFSPQGNAEDSYTGKVVVIPVGEDSLTSSASFGYMNRVMKRAQEENAKAIIFELNTPGGLAWETCEMMTNTLPQIKIPTYAFVNTKAISAGALISVACDKIYMAPVASIGAAGIINSSGEEMDKMVRQKAESAFGAFTRSVVTEKGYRPDVVKAMMIPCDKEQKFGPVTLEKNALLTLTSKEACTIMPDGKPLLATGIVKDVAELLALEKLDAPVIIATPTGFESLALWIAWASPILILLGLGGIYFEFKMPGTGIGAVVAIVAFGLFFFGNNVAGNLAGYETVALLIIGITLIILEIFVVPTTFITGLAGGICILIALFGGMISTLEWEHIMRDNNWCDVGLLYSILIWPLLKLVLGVTGSTILITLMMKFLPDTKLLNPISNTTISGGSAGEAVNIGTVQIGDLGTASTELKPNGKAIINGQICEVVSQQGILEKGTPIRVVSIRPFEYVVVKDENHLS